MLHLIKIDKLEIACHEDGNQSGVIFEDSKLTESTGESNGSHISGESDLMGRNYFEFHQLTIEKVENRLNEIKKRGIEDYLTSLSIASPLAIASSIVPTLRKACSGR